MKLIKRTTDFLVAVLNRISGIFGLTVLKKRSYGPYVIDIWDYNDEFEGIYGKIKGLAGVTKRSLYVIYQALHQISSLPGDVVECGVYKGGSAYLIAGVTNKLAPDKNVLLFDTFTGLPDTNIKYDPALDNKNTFQDTSVERVKALLGKYKNCNIYEGLYKETLKSVAEKTFCFVHVDCDLYDSIICACEFLYPRLKTGGMIVFDDYGYTIDWPGAKRAVDEFFCDKKEKPIHLPTGQGVIIKL